MYVFSLIAILSIALLVLYKTVIYIIDRKIFRNAQHLRKFRMKNTSRKNRKHKLQKKKDIIVYTGIPPDDEIAC